MPRTLEVRELRISEPTANKILSRHGLHADEIRGAVQGVGRLPFSWDNAADPGKAILVVAIRDRPVLVVLFPAEGKLGTVWNLGSAYFDDE